MAVIKSLQVEFCNSNNRYIISFNVPPLFANIKLGKEKAKAKHMHKSKKKENDKILFGYCHWLPWCNQFTFNQAKCFFIFFLSSPASHASVQVVYSSVIFLDLPFKECNLILMSSCNYLHGTLLSNSKRWNKLKVAQKKCMSCSIHMRSGSISKLKQPPP